MLRFGLAFLAALLVSSPAFAQAGRVLMAVGDVVAVRGAQELRLGVGAAVESGDTVRLGPDSNAQIRMSDESIISLRERTVFRIDEYVYSGKVDGSEKSLFSLLAGGMRTVTGIIGNLRSTEKYAVRTATSTIGIRGTHYTLRECQNDCFEPRGAGGTAGAPIQLASAARNDAGPLAQAPAPVGKPVPDGTYGGVTDGRIGVVNNVADQEFGAKQYFYVANRDTSPQGLLVPPGFLFDRLDGQKRSSGQKGRETGETLAEGGINAESRPSDVPAGPKPSDFIVTEQRTSTGALTVVGAMLDTGALAGWITPGSFHDLVAGGALIPQSALTIGPGGVLQAFTVPVNCIGPNADCASPPSATLGAPAESGNATFPNSTQKVFWGRWASGTIVDSGQTITLNSATQGHFMYGPLTPSDVIVGKSGTIALQSSFPGGLGTSPSNNFGALASATTVLPTITVDFTTRIASLSAWNVAFPNVGTGTQNWTFAGGATGSIVVAPGAGAHFLVDNIAGSCNSGGPAMACNGTSFFAAKGRAAGIFIGPAGDHAGVALGGAAGTSQFNTVRVYCPTC